MGMRGSYILFWVYTEVRMISFVGDKWGDTVKDRMVENRGVE